MEAVPAPDVFSDTRFLAFDHADAMVDAVVGFADSDESIIDDAFFMFVSHETTVSPDIFTVGVHVNTQGITNNTTPFDEVKTLPTLFNTTTIESIAAAAAASQVQSGSWNYGLTLTFNNDRRIAQLCVELHTELVESLKTLMAPESFYTQMFLQPLPAYRWPIGKQRGGNVLGLDNLTNNALLYTAGVGILDNDAPVEAAHAQVKAMAVKLVDFAKSVQGDMEFIYLNYADSDQDPLGTYGAANIQLMKDVAAKYDPTGIFQTRIPGGYKISQVQ
ncbi:hypothetical protein ONZ43_g6242 [Nemania bipapillata]|uniref:Uncharacterized protein n=1 Tax=Nemania bipapillata TaxID=110536 RepID=A0ACC2I248_9PEZI|nr:hypothetical protein ONZ43_g6242 [Nemania bipapillata]